MDFDDDLIRLLAELGFIASGYGMIDKSDLIAAGLRSIRPQSEQPHLLQALTRIGRNEAEAAERILREQALKNQPDSSMAKAFLGVTLHMQGRMTERDRVLNDVVAVNDDTDAVRIASDLLPQSAPAAR